MVFNLISDIPNYSKWVTEISPWMLLEKGKITQDMISFLDNWRQSGFNVFSGPRILPRV